MSVIYKNGTYYGAGGGGEGADTEIIADDFDPTESYDVGDYVVYEGILYKCTTAHTGAWDASDFDATQVMEEMPTPMPAADMSDIVSPLPSVMSRRFKYSTEEQVIGEWIDGKPIYQKTLHLPNTTISNTQTNVGDISDLNIKSGSVVDIVAMNNNYFVGVGYLGTTLRIPEGNIGILKTAATSSTTYDLYITLQYTKTTD